MKSKILAIWFTAFFALSIVGVHAQSAEPAYNFGTAQPRSSVMIEPGEETSEKILVYNIHGNRITHVTFSVTGVLPSGWEITLDPEVHTVTTRVSGEDIEISESLYAEPSEPVAAPPADIPEGMEYLQAAGVDGYIPAKVLNVNIKVPEDYPLGETHTITVNAKATWLGQGGIVALSQDRNFPFSVKTITREYTEEIITETPVPIAEEKVEAQVPWMYVFGGAIAAVLAVGILAGLVYFVRRKK